MYSNIANVLTIAFSMFLLLKMSEMIESPSVCKLWLYSTAAWGMREECNKNMAHS